MKTSPMLATLGSIGSGIGSRSPKGPAIRRNCASSVNGRSTWKDGHEVGGREADERQ